MLKSMKKLQSPDRVMNTIQDNVETALRPLLTNPLLDGTLIENVSIPTGSPKTIEHGLGRAVRGWYVVSPQANAVVWETPSALPTKTLILNSSANVDCKLWVY